MMPQTVYTIHRACDHAIAGTATPGDLQQRAAEAAQRLCDTNAGRTVRAYVHNGRGVIAAGLCRDGIWHDILRDDYRAFDGQAREARTAQGWPNDPDEQAEPEARPAYLAEERTT